MMSSKERQQQQQQQLLVARGESLPLLHVNETSSSRGQFEAKTKSFFSFVGGKGKGKDDASSSGGSKKAALLFVSGFSLVAACSLLILQASRDGARSVRLLGATTYYENPVYADNNTDPMSERDVNDIKTSKMTLTLHTGCSPHEKLPWTIEDKKTWGNEVGAKIIFKTDSNDFFFERGVEMDNAGCGSYSVETDELLVGTQFGFALYQKNNVTTSHHATKDIGCRSESGSDPRCPSWKSPHSGEGEDGDGVRGGPMEMTECTFQYKYGDVTFYNRVFDGETTDYVWGSCLDTCPSFTRTPYCGDAEEVPHMGKVEVREDEKCVPGEYLQVNGKCQKCPVGHYSEEALATECQPCAAGTMQPHEGQTECIACPYGWYQSEIGQQYCESCPGSRADSSRRKLQGGMMKSFKKTTKSVKKTFDWSKFGSIDGWEWIQNTTETIVNKTETAYDDAKNAVNNTLASGADAVKQTAKKTTDVVSSAFSKTKETAEDSKDAVDKVAENAKEKADDAMNDAQTSTTSAVNDAKESAESASEDVKEAAKETKDNVEKATEDPKEVVEDGVNGVKKATVSAEEAAEDAAKEAKDNVEKATENPKEVVEDGVNGVKKATISAEEAAEDAANASKESVEDTAEKVKSGFDGSNSEKEDNSNGSESSSNSDVESTTTTTTTKQEQEENEKQESSGPMEEATPSPSSSSFSTPSTISTTSVTSTTTTTPATTTTTTYSTTTTTSDKQGATSLAQCPASPSFEEEEEVEDDRQQPVGQIGEEEKTETTTTTTTAPKTASSYRRGFHQTNSKPRSWAV